MIFATVEAVTCVRRNPETSSTDLRIVARSVHDCKKIVIYSEHRQKQIKFRHRIHLKLDVSFRFPLLLLHVLSALQFFSLNLKYRKPLHANFRDFGSSFLRQKFILL